jgi:tetratricopeptide (TPR) repeat protein
VTLAAAVGVAGAALVGAMRAPLAATYEKIKERSDVYALPLPEQTVVLSLGYRAALADFLFAHVLVWHGLNYGEKRRLEFAADYLDTIVTLDPTFRDPYYFGDTLIATQPVKPRREDYVRARRLLEKGMAARPFDTELWLSGGQFIAYVAAPWLEDPKETQEWRLAGARYLAHACELVTSNDNIPYQCITAASLFTKAGATEAAVDFLERLLAVSDDEEIRDVALKLLMVKLDEREKERATVRADEVRSAARADLSFVGLTKALVIGPGFDPARCAGGDDSRDCSTSYAAWRARGQAELR